MADGNQRRLASSNPSSRLLSSKNIERTHVGQRLVCKELQSTLADTFQIWQVYVFAKQLSIRLFISMLLFVYLP